MKLDCKECGACCIGNLEATSYVHVYDVDVARLPESFRRDKLVQLGTSPMSGWATHALATREAEAGAACCALVGDIGGPVRCGIYDVRPDACRRFEPGSPPCMAARFEHDLASRCGFCGELYVEDIDLACPRCGDSRYDPTDLVMDDILDARRLALKERW